MICRRFGSKPLLTRCHLPQMPPEIVDASSVFNPGAMAIDGVTYLLLRVQTRGRRTFLVPAHSHDGAEFRVAQRPVQLLGLDGLSGSGLHVYHVYDPRITVMEDRIHVVTAMDTDRGCRLAIWRTAGNPGSGFAGLDNLMLVGLVRGSPDGTSGVSSGHENTRNGVLFPERIDGRYAMLHRPNGPQSDGPASGNTIVFSQSDDLRIWDTGRAVLSGRPHYWDELIGSGPPPLKTEKGWLHVYHGVATHFQSVNIYQAGAVLLDLADPTRVLGRTRDNLLEPREGWEVTGQVPNVVFPSGWVADTLDDAGHASLDSRVRIYYGAADTVVARADTTVAELISACE
jgi:beta-1,4-mannooligosaccharide/beta-1,4-mannosyl-N-acetylglucosamine phosphorylase